MPEIARSKTGVPRVLVVDDEDPIRQLVMMGLLHEHFEVESAGTGRTALKTAELFRPDLIVLDVGLPDLDGFEVCRRLRADGMPVPVIFLTARKAIEDKLTGLTIGGDDYVTKPFSFAELLARIRIILRRQEGSTADADRLVLADLEVDERAHEVRRHAQRIDLTPTEYNLLVFLLANAGAVMSRAQILDHVWNYDFGGDSAVVETYIYYLRKKIDAFDPPLIHTVRGVGYTIRLPPG
ncbi:MAG: response regulator transcription factor [Acidimicrobiales bacterium]